MILGFMVVLGQLGISYQAPGKEAYEENFMYALPYVLLVEPAYTVVRSR